MFMILPRHYAVHKTVTAYLRHKAYKFLQDTGHSSQCGPTILLLTKGEQKVLLLRELIEIHGNRGSPGLFLPECCVVNWMSVLHRSLGCGLLHLDQRTFHRGPSGRSTDHFVGFLNTSCLKKTYSRKLQVQTFFPLKYIKMYTHLLHYLLILAPSRRALVLLFS